MMDDAQRKLLEDRKTIILPDEIDHDAYSLIVEAAILYPDEEIDLICRGDGGYSSDAFAMIDIIRRHGKFVGLLPGVGSSSHGLVWAGCNVRYVYPFGKLGVHRVVKNSMPDNLTSDDLFQMAESPHQVDQEMALVYESASNRGYAEWIRIIEGHSIGLKWFKSKDLIQMKMALPIADHPRGNLCGDNSKKPACSNYNPPPVEINGIRDGETVQSVLDAGGRVIGGKLYSKGAIDELRETREHYEQLQRRESDEQKEEKFVEAHSRDIQDFVFGDAK